MNTTDDILWRAMVYCGPSANRRHCRTLSSARYCSRTRTRLRGETVMAAAAEKPTKDKLLSTLDDIEVLSRELIEMLALSRTQKLPQPGEDTDILELLVQRDREFQELMQTALEQGRVQQEMQALEKEVEKRDSDIQQLQKQLKEAEHILATAVYQAKEKLKSIEKARKGSISSEEIIKYAHRISASNAVCAPLNWVPGDPRRPYPTDLEMRSGILGNMSNMPTNGVNGHLPGDALAAGRLPGRFTLLCPPSALFFSSRLSLSYKYCGLCVAVYFSVELQYVSLMFIFANVFLLSLLDILTPQYPWQSADVSMGILPPHHGNDFGLEPPGHNKENEDDVEAMSTDSSSSSSDSD
uniref:Mediator of RNA polymerase II transcription subunit 4 n=1 Tax=Cyprinus carpio carpio TaxID=630221 RepID=A0A9J8BV37_CYPCA